MAIFPVLLPSITISNAGTAVKIASGKNIVVAKLVLEADHLNTGNIYWGDATVTANNGNTIPAGESVTIEFEGGDGGHGKVDLTTMFLDADTSGNKARCTYFINY